MRNKHSEFLNRGKIDLHKFFYEKILKHSQEHNGIGSYPLTEIRAIMSCSFKKSIMNRIIIDLENADLLRYSKSKGRIFLSGRLIDERQNRRC